MAAAWFRSKSLKNCCEWNHFLIKLLTFTSCNSTKKFSFTGIFQRYWREVKKNYVWELHTKEFYRSTLSFAENHSMADSKAKYEKAIHNSVKCCSFHEKMQLILLNLSTKILFSNKIKQSIFFYEMNPFSVLYHRKIEKSFTLLIDKINLKLKQQNVSALVQVVV